MRFFLKDYDVNGVMGHGKTVNETVNAKRELGKTQVFYL